MDIKYRAIGVIHTPFNDIAGMPIQPSGGIGVRGSIEVFPKYINGLQDLAGFSHIIMLYHFHQVKGFALTVTPFLDTLPRGLFATRAPKRPNPIGLSIVKLIEIEHRTLIIENIDVLDQTPLLDIKPYIPEFDNHPADRIGWLEKARNQVQQKRSDSRFDFQPS